MIIEKYAKNNNRKEFVKNSEDIHNSALNTNFHIAPTKGIDNGIGGKDYESQLKIFYGLTNGKYNISKTGRTDLSKYGFYIQAKINNGEVGLWNGTEWEYMTGDLIYYCYDYKPEIEITKQQIYVAPVKIFYNFIFSAKTKRNSLLYRIDKIRQNIKIDILKRGKEKEDLLFYFFDNFCMDINDFDNYIISNYGTGKISKEERQKILDNWLNLI